MTVVLVDGAPVIAAIEKSRAWVEVEKER